MSCLDFSILREGGDLELEVSRKCGDLELNCSPVGGMSLAISRLEGDLKLKVSCRTSLSMRIAIVCPTNLGEETFLWSCEGLILSVENGKFILRRTQDGQL